MVKLRRPLLAAASVSSAASLLAPQPATKPLTARSVLASPVDAPWSPGSWRNYEAKQIPKYDEEKLRKAEE